MVHAERSGDGRGASRHCAVPRVRRPGLDSRIPDESTIPRFRHLLEKNKLTDQILAHVNDLLRGKGLHGEEDTVFADSGYRGAHKRADAKPGVTWHIAVRPSDRKRLKAGPELGAVLDKIETLKASVRAEVEHPFRVIKRQFGHTKVRYRGLFKNTAQLKTLFALSNLWMARWKLMARDEQIRPMRARTA
jgi:IS5 family transposase